jgi:DNA-binding transcriptional regulator YiaG
MAKDFLVELVEERTERNPGFPRLVAEAEVLKLARKLASLREKKALSQTVVAARMGTAASVVSKLEAGGDVKVSTLQRYCAAIGERFSVAQGPRRRPEPPRGSRPRVVGARTAARRGRRVSAPVDGD